MTLAQAMGVKLSAIYGLAQASAADCERARLLTLGLRNMATEQGGAQ